MNSTIMDDHLKSLAERASKSMQEIQKILGTKTNIHAKIRFPRGFVRKADDYKAIIPVFIKEPTRSNLAYNRMFCDIVHWLALRTDLYGIVLEMCIKHGIISLAAISETLTHHSVSIPRRGYIYGGKEYKGLKGQVYKLQEKGIIDQKLAANIIEMWKLRCKIHILKLDKNGEFEFNTYTKGLS